jgi:hypothetical protein
MGKKFLSDGLFSPTLIRDTAIEIKDRNIKWLQQLQQKMH